MPELDRKNQSASQPKVLTKSATGINGFDEITRGGLPCGRPSLICGAAGCGKTLFSMEFLINGISQYDEPGVFVAFEERSEDLVKNFASLGYDLNDLIAKKKLVVDYVYIDRSEIAEAGQYDLEGLFIRLGFAIDSVKANRVVLDTIETLFAGFDNQALLRAELRRLFLFLKEKGVTAIVTGEKGEKTLTRYGLEEYVADCVVYLDHSITQQVATRRVRVIKYRGSAHGTNEYPFLIDESGITVIPISSLTLDHKISHERISTGIPRLDTMLGGQGFYRGSSILISGTAGSGKSSIASQIINAACQRGERCLYFAFEESKDQIIRNMKSIGIDLEQWVHKGLLKFHNVRATLYGLEMHLATMHKTIENFDPSLVVVDPISNLVSMGNSLEVKAMLSRLIDFLKMKMMTAIFNDLTTSSGGLEQTDIGISSLMDAWILLKIMEDNGERNRGIYILKARGVPHSNQVREFVITSNGIHIRDVYIGSDRVFMGSARVSQQAREKVATIEKQKEIELKERQIKRKEDVLNAQICAMRTEFESAKEDFEQIVLKQKLFEEIYAKELQNMLEYRHADRNAQQ